ncbi:hypothetical protein ABIB99_004939 [Bradyrhizobium sp. LA6.1]|uniref:hypothetical protein n=1 Tax=Bradyrhizobium sp. LA6.1 TaxID=3156378 RepID=UPI00339AE945
MAVDGTSTITAWAVFSAIGGSLTGAVVGGTINYFLQRASRAEAKKQRDDDRLEVRRALAYSLLFKLIRVVSDLENLRKAVAESVEHATASGLKGALWQMVLPVANLPDAVDFSADEMALVLSLDDQTFNQIAALDKLHESTIAIFCSYGQQREALVQKFGASMQGSIGTTQLTKEDAEWLAPRAHMLNDLVVAMKQRTEVDAVEARDGLTSVHSLFVKELGIKKRLEFKKPSDASPDHL